MEHKEAGFVNQIGMILPFEVKKSLETDPVARLLFITDIGYYPDARNHYIARDGGAGQHILIYCVSGSGFYVIDGCRHDVKAGQFFVIAAETPHSYGASESDPWSIYWIHFTGEQSGLFREMFGRTQDIPDAGSSRNEERIGLFREIFRTLEMGYTIDNLRYSTLCLWHLLGSFIYVRQFREVARGRTTDVIQRSIEFMRANLGSQLSLKEIAENVSYSPSHFGKLFASKTNQTPLDYFNQMKIQAACRDLDFTTLKIKEIAFKLGFYDQYHFSKVFFRYMNISPSAYRSKHGE